MPVRADGRCAKDIRPLSLIRDWLPHAEGSCLVELGGTRVVVSASVVSSLPPWRAGQGSGWITAEYGMLPRATHTRNRRPVNAGQQNGRTMEIQRMVGRAFRIVSDFELLGERTIYLDCDVLSADGGTRTASIIGASVALHDVSRRLAENGSIGRPLMRELVAAVSVGFVGGELAVDLTYGEDSSAEVDMTVVMTESGSIVEVQGAAEKRLFNRERLDAMIDAAEPAIGKIIRLQHQILETA
jgi:ribonuclease PH